MIEHIQPEGLYPSERLGFSQVVTATPGRLAWIAGQTACDVAGRPVGGRNIGTQASVALENLRVALAAMGAGPKDVTMLRVYVVGLTREVAAHIAPTFHRFFAGAQPPASTWIGVQSLLHPDFLIEIEAVAAVDA